MDIFRRIRSSISLDYADAVPIKKIISDQPPQVEGYDYSQGFVEMMLGEKAKGNVENLTAYQGDSHKQKELTRSKHFDMILGCNLIDRLHTPCEWILQSKVRVLLLFIVQ